MVHHEPRIPSYIKHLNKGLKDSGIILSFFTGKMPYNFHDLSEDIGRASDVVFAHGGFVPGSSINHSFDASPLKNIVLHALKKDVSVSIQFDNEETVLGYTDEDIINAVDFWTRPVYRIKFENPLHNGTLRELEESNASLLSNYNVFRDKYMKMEITALENNKALAIKDMVQKYGLSPDEVLVIGASEHDIPVFEWAKHSVAVGNAHYMLKAKAGYVADRNYDSGYVDAISKYFPEIVKAAKLDSNTIADWYN